MKKRLASIVTVNVYCNVLQYTFCIIIFFFELFYYYYIIIEKTFFLFIIEISSQVTVISLEFYQRFKYSKLVYFIVYT